jgi:FAD/FMN-containing dehydrogenase
VLPSGDIETVDEKHRPDLFKALKGAGSNNFGIVTSFNVETFPLPNPAGLWVSMKTYSYDKVPALRRARPSWMTTGVDTDFDTGGYEVSGYYGAQNMSMVVAQRIHTAHTSAETMPDVFSAYKDIEALQGADITRVMPMSALTEEISSSNPNGLRNTYATFTYKPTPEYEEKLFQIFEEGLEKVKHVPGIVAFMPLQPLSKRAMQQMSKRGGNSLGLDGSEGSLVICLNSWMWARSEDDALIFQTTKDIINKSEALAKEMGLWHRFKYMNYAEKWQADDIYSGYGKENHQQLKQLQRKIDPEGIFTKGGLCGGYFMLNEKVERTVKEKDEL